jgi:ATPase subunit of ABC transporter with duplicated ATPase domains
MLSVNNVSLIFPGKVLFEEVNLNFTEGNCYGIIGANGAGKSTFLKILSGEIDSSKGTVVKSPNARMAVLKQNHFEFDEYSVLDAVLYGHKRLFDITKQKEELYAKTEFTNDELNLIGELESEYATLNGWEAEYEIKKMLNELEIDSDNIDKKMHELSGREKMKVLLAQVLFNEPDIILMDEPTNELDFKTIKWLEEFLINYDKTVIVVSHDRHFLNKVCTHMVDIDYKSAKMFPGNYDFWYESSQLLLRMQKEGNKKKEQRVKELEEFIARFSANASKSKQATSRKKSLEKIVLDEILPSNRRYPYVGFSLNRPLGNDILLVENLSYSLNDKTLFKNVSFTINKNDKAVIISKDDATQTIIMKILAGELIPDTGTIKWGQTVEMGYLPLDNSSYFENNKSNLIEWLSNYSKDKNEQHLRSFLGRMLFSGEEPLKTVNVLSGGEKVRCMLSKMMIAGSNFLILDQPTNHLDLESIEAVNRGLMEYQGGLIFTSHDYAFINTIANKVIEIREAKAIVYDGLFDEYVEKR